LPENLSDPQVLGDKIDNQGVAGVKAFFDMSVLQLKDLTALVRTPISKLGRKTMEALLVIEVHARDVVKRFIDKGLDSQADFEWLSQLRYYWNDEEVDTSAGKSLGLQAKMCQCVYPYGYEYLGNSGRLVITPLTDRCYMTLMGAMHLTLGGAPAGPAGTGKTESVKDLAKALAKHCVVFNCSDGLDFKQMAKFFKGLATEGAWACFDEFNRINVEVLSVVAQQILTIQQAIERHDDKVLFEGTTIGLNATFNVFITMNPGYAGRTELPDNLKVLFRPMSMMVPDYALIAEIRNFSFGFDKSRPLAEKLVATFKLSSEQLSSQSHYDYGMRAVNTVISASGLLKKQFPDMDEDELLYRAVRDSNKPKFLKDDISLFQGIMGDVFSGTKEPVAIYPELEACIAKHAVANKLQCVEQFQLTC
jgi:dynein heavy chain